MNKHTLQAAKSVQVLRTFASYQPVYDCIEIFTCASIAILSSKPPSQVLDNQEVLKERV